ncbi:hypothetical protein LWI28_016754 [Acer negundo]|uniref:Uncharacterized protein n=1 Tax=Acer negundo TaxID=4023 RepID=A0AAD5P2A9_ACENE|nr:hypothetical protein LWI28_016754 [Acer negundo]
MSKQMEALTKNVSQLQAGANHVCDGGHHCRDGKQMESVEAQTLNYQRGRNDPYSNTYNPELRNHPNFSYSDPNIALNSHQLTFPNQGTNQGGYNRGNYQGQGSTNQPQQWHNSTNRDIAPYQPNKLSLEDLVTSLAQSSHTTEQNLNNFIQVTGQKFTNIEASIKKRNCQTNACEDFLCVEELGNSPAKPSIQGSLPSSPPPTVTTSTAKITAPIQGVVAAEFAPTNGEPSACEPSPETASFWPVAAKFAPTYGDFRDSDRRGFSTLN